MIAVREVQPIEANGVVYVEVDVGTAVMGKDRGGRKVVRFTRGEAAELAERLAEYVERYR